MLTFALSLLLGVASASASPEELDPADAESLDPMLTLQLARAAETDGRLAEAFRLLDEGARRFPDARELSVRQILLAIEMGLLREAIERARASLGRQDADPELAVAIAEALRGAGALRDAELLLTEAVLRFPGALELRVASAAVAFAAGRPRDAAGQLSVVAAADAEWADETAELYREARDLDAALRWNSAVVDPTEKARQRLGLLLEHGRWDQVLALEARITRLGLLEDSAVCYALAYAHFRAGDLDRAEAHLGRITDPQVFATAQPLRSAMTDCREDPWSCP